MTGLSPETELGGYREAELLFALSRRHAMPFSVLAVFAERGAAPGSLHVVGGVDGPFETPSVEERIAPLLRGTDVLVSCDASGHSFVFCAGTDASGADELARRLAETLAGFSVETGRASFGEDALTLGDLVDAARARLPRRVRDDDPSGGAGAFRVVPHGHGHGRSRRPAWRRRLSERIKRALDLGLVAVTAPFWLVTFGLVAGAIKLTDPRAPVIFVQHRTGRGGRRFPMYKFRTMVPDAEAMKERLRARNELRWPDFKIRDDPRITRLGRLLRRTSLDELPQLWNVIRGDMSLVGPRPTSFEPATYEPWQTARLEVPPGLTGLWQVEGRASTKFDERIRIELDYIERQSLWLDLWILVRTIPAVLQMRGGQ